MQEINNLVYFIQINYVNESGLNVSICRKMDDEGLEMNSIQVGDVCVSEETINGRILSGRYDSSKSSCGYKYNYEKQDDEYLVSINKDISLNEAVNLINKTKMSSAFLNAKMVFNSILRQDYRVVVIDKANMVVTKTIVAGKYLFQERVALSKLQGEEFFSEKYKESIYQINGKNVTTNKEIRLQFKELVDIVNQNPNTYKDLLSLKAKDYKLVLSSNI